MAAAVLSHRGSQLKDVSIHVTSSGTSSWNVGQGPHPTSKLVWEKAGYSYEHRASQFSANDYFDNDYILVMDSSNYENVLSLSPSQDENAKVFYLRSFDPTLSHIDPASSDYFALEVPDPYNQHEDSYKQVLTMIESAVDGFISHLTQDRDV